MNISARVTMKIKINNNPSKILAPGQSKIHYSPGIPIRLNVNKVKKEEAFILLREKKNSKQNLLYRDDNRFHLL